MLLSKLIDWLDKRRLVDQFREVLFWQKSHFHVLVQYCPQFSVVPNLAQRDPNLAQWSTYMSIILPACVARILSNIWNLNAAVLRFAN
jgi:hypothetical protein